jgi:ATP-binding cassette subfamily B protein
MSDAPGGTSPSLIRPIRGRLIGAIAVEAFAAAAGAIPPIAVVELGRILLSPSPDADRAWLVVVIAAIAVVVRLLLAIIASTISHYAENDLQLGIRRALIERLGRLPLGWFNAHSSGVVKQAVGDDVDALHHLVAHSALELTAAIVAPVVSLAYLFLIDWRLALITLVPLAVGIVLFRQAGCTIYARIREDVSGDAEDQRDSRRVRQRRRRREDVRPVPAVVSALRRRRRAIRHRLETIH